MSNTRINFRARPLSRFSRASSGGRFTRGYRLTFSERMERGGVFFYTVAVLAGLGLFGVVWLMLALGTLAGF